MLSVVLQGVLTAALTGSSSGAAVSDTSTTRLDLLGIHVCMGESTDGLPCHIRLFPARSQSSDKADGDGMPAQLSLFGKKICLGRVPQEVACDWRLGAAESGSSIEA